MHGFVERVAALVVSIGVGATFACAPRSPARATYVARAAAPSVPDAADRFIPARLSRNARPVIHPEPFAVAALPRLWVPAYATASDGAPVPHSAGELPAQSERAGAGAGPAAFAFRGDARAIVQPGTGSWHLRCARALGAEGLIASQATWGAAAAMRVDLLAARSPGGGTEPPTFEVAHLWLDPIDCSVLAARRMSARPSRIARGLMLALRVCEGDCRDREELWILMPRVASIVHHGLGADVDVASGGFTRLRIPLRRGTAASMVARISGSECAAWMRERVAELPDGPLTTGVEVAFGAGDAEPVALAWIGEERALTGAARAAAAGHRLAAGAATW